MCNLSREDFLPESIIKVHANLQEGKETQDTVLVEQSMNSDRQNEDRRNSPRMETHLPQ